MVSMEATEHAGCMRESSSVQGQDGPFPLDQQDYLNNAAHPQPPVPSERTPTPTVAHSPQRTPPHTPESSGPQSLSVKLQGVYVV